MQENIETNVTEATVGKDSLRKLKISHFLGIVIIFFLFFLFIFYYNFSTDNSRRSLRRISPSDSKPTPTPTHSIKKLFTVFELPKGWTKKMYSQDVDYYKEGFPGSSCLPEQCLFFESKKYIHEENTYYSSPYKEGRLMGFANFISARNFLSNSVSGLNENNFYQLFLERFPETTPYPSTECGPIHIREKPQKVVLGNYQTILSITHPLCNYEADSVTYIQEGYYLLLDESTILAIYLNYDKASPISPPEKNRFLEALSTLKINNRE